MLTISLVETLVKAGLESMEVSGPKSGLLICLLFGRVLPRTAIGSLADETTTRSTVTIVPVGAAVRSSTVVVTVTVSSVGLSILRLISPVGVVDSSLELLFLFVRGDRRLKLVDEVRKLWRWICDCNPTCRYSLACSDDLVVKEVLVLEVVCK